jgi:polyisoprenoid-binding protein YceI
MSISEQAISIPTGTWQVDVVHSSVGFEVPYMGISTFSGTVKSFEATLADGTLTGSAQIASLVTKDENLQAQLPEITIKGVAQPATLTGTLTDPVADPYGKERYGLSLTTTIDRTKFGITWNAPMPDGQRRSQTRSPSRPTSRWSRRNAMPKPAHARQPGRRAERSELPRLVRRIQALTLELQEPRRRELDHADVEAKERLLEQLRWQLAAVARRAATEELGNAA